MQSAIDSKVNGIALTLAKPDAMAPAVKAALGARVFRWWRSTPGFDNFRRWASRSTSARTKSIAGVAAGERLNKDGAKKVICVIQEQGQVDAGGPMRRGQDQGFQGQSEILNVNSKDMPSVESTITAKLQQDPSVDHVVALGAPIALAAVQSVEATRAAPRRSSPLTPMRRLVDAIKNGDVQWAVDQQPFLQGYLAVDSLWLYLNNGNVIGGGQPTLTGPSFIDKSNIDAVAEYAKNGTR